jgi:SAM-dependent methyltransferase
MGEFYSKMFARTYDTFISGLERSLYKKRHALLSTLDGDILDVGSGTGVNFSFYNEDTRVTAVEPSQSMLNIAKNKIGDHRNIDFHQKGINDKGLEDHLMPQSFDAIVSTLVLCTIPDPALALDKFKRWLKPDGKLVILEHIHAQNSVNRSIQKIINPAWKFCGDGCNLTRDTDELVRQAGFQPVSEEYFKRTLRFYAGVFTLEQAP